MAIVHVGTSTSASGSGTSATVTYSPTAGNLLIAAVKLSGGSARTAGSGWTALTEAGVSAILRYFWKIAGSGETSETPETWTGTVTWGVILDEYSGVASASPVDVENNAINASATPLTTPIVTPTASVERLVTCALSTTSGGSWSSDQVNASATGVGSRATIIGMHVLDLVVPSTSGTYQGRSTPSATTATEVAAIATLKGAAVTTLPPTGYRVFQAVKRASFY